MSLAGWIKDQGGSLGFARVGIAPATDLPELGRFPEWLARGYAGPLDYLHNPRRRDARRLLPDARSVICCSLAYDTPHPRSTEVPPDPERSWVSRYAWGDDYHDVVAGKLEALRDALAEKAGPGFTAKLYVDTGPVLERVYAAHAGLGWQAKNTCLLDAELGSFFFLGLLVTNLELAADAPLPEGCGACTLCLDACPTGALVEPGVLDARRCLSTLTIELRGAIPEQFRHPLGRHVFGCDICQDVCPYNRRAVLSDLPAFTPRPLPISQPNLLSPVAPATEKTETRSTLPPASPPGGDVSSGQAFPPSPEAPASGDGDSLFHPRLEWLAGLREEEFRRIFQKSAVKRARWQGLVRNTLVAMGNSGNPRFRPLLERFAAGADPLLAEHARWALAQLPES